VSWLTDGGSKQRCCCFKRRRERVFLFPSPLVFRFFFFLCFFYQRSSPYPLGFVLFLFLNFPPGFKLPLNLSFLSLFRSSLFGHFFFRFVLSVRSPSSPVFSFFLCVFSSVTPISVGIECGIYRAKGSGGRPYCRPIAVRGERRQPALPRRQRAWVCRARPC